ncbi:hypothetical protein [Mesorhizobium sp. CA5]|uniref:hypothetical protein n=1 Tax=Mesorhizobium sp. CA5 TaxID=2876638 RepID=UPI001CD0DA14|nr:hypothetical protein [Mesorhizobium sp. CA5]MBZ9841934.1 hypothetical protein [Mesorhizobium sp. CA5]
MVWAEIDEHGGGKDDRRSDYQCALDRGIHLVSQKAQSLVPGDPDEPLEVLCLFNAAGELLPVVAVVSNSIPDEEGGDCGNDQQNWSHRTITDLRWLEPPDDGVLAHPQHEQARRGERRHDDKRHRDVDQD